MTMLRRSKYVCAAALAALTALAGAQPVVTYDLADRSAAAGDFLRVHGSSGEGRFGVPLDGGFDCDGDGFVDYTIAFMTAPVDTTSRAGETALIFGDGTIGGVIDTAVDQAGVLKFQGVQENETSGNVVWMDDVTGDGLGDLIIGRQNYTPTGRLGAGAISIVVGGAAWKTQAATLEPISLDAPPEEIDILTIIGGANYNRLGVWLRTGDATGDGIADIVVGADQEDLRGFNSGTTYLIRGGPHLAATATVDLADFGQGALDGDILRIVPPANSGGFHLGATCNIGDLDADGRGEVFTAAAFSRSGQTIRPTGAPTGEYQASGGAQNGTLFIVWGEHFGDDPWTTGLTLALDDPGVVKSSINGDSDEHIRFGEEMLGGLDYDGDGRADLYVGDLSGDSSPLGNRSGSGAGVAFYQAELLKGLVFDLDDPLPPGIRTTRVAGPSPGAIGSDTLAQGDFDRDGLGDVLIGNPYDNPEGRTRAGTIHILYGRHGGWPDFIDTAPGQLPPPSQVRVALIQGAKGRTNGNEGDVLCYSGSAGDIDGDGHTDVLTNEMVGDGTSTIDVGNLVIISGADLVDFQPTNMFVAH